MADREGGGRALRRAIHVARARAGITSDSEVAQLAGIHYDTLMNWYSDRTTPRPAEVRKVADALGASFADLMAAYEGRAPERPTLEAAIGELVSEMRESRKQQETATLALLRAVTALTLEHQEGRGAGPRAMSAPSTIRGRRAP